MSDFDTTPAFDPMDIDLSDVDMEVYEDPETGATTYDKPVEQSLTNVAEETESDWMPEDEPADLTSAFADVDDDAEIDFGEVKLPKRTVVELAQKRQDIESEHTYVKELASNLKHSEKHLEFIKQRSLSEVDKQIAAINSMLSDPQLSDAERGARVRQLQGLQSRQSQLNAEFEQGQMLIEGQKAELLGQRIKSTDEAMIGKYGQEWVTSANDTYNFAIGLGVPPDALKEVLCPAIADIFVMARKWATFEGKRKEKANAEIKATIARSKQPRQTHTRTESSPSQNTAAFQQKLKQGRKLSKDDLADGFDPDWAR